MDAATSFDVGKPNAMSVDVDILDSMLFQCIITIVCSTKHHYNTARSARGAV